MLVDKTDSSKFKIKGNLMKTAIVTGGSGGIGQEICRRLAADRMRVVVHYGSNKSAADKVVQSIKGDGGAAIAVSAKISDESEISKLFDAATDEFGGVDVVVANAGVAGRGVIKGYQGAIQNDDFGV